MWWGEFELAAPELAAREPYEGHSGMRGYLGDLARTWAEFRVTIHEYHGAGERVLARGRVYARSFKALDVQVARFRRGGAAARPEGRRPGLCLDSGARVVRRRTAPGRQLRRSGRASAGPGPRPNRAA